MQQLVKAIFQINNREWRIDPKNYNKHTEAVVSANLPCSPGWMQSITSLSASTALTGITPPPNAFPSIWISN